jgi:hypothetical protein
MIAKTKKDRGKRTTANQIRDAFSLRPVNYWREPTMSYPSLIAETVTFVAHNGDSGEAYYARPTRDHKFPGVVVVHHLQAGMSGPSRWFASSPITAMQRFPPICTSATVRAVRMTSVRRCGPGTEHMSPNHALVAHTGCTMWAAANSCVRILVANRFMRPRPPELSGISEEVGNDKNQHS